MGRLTDRAQSDDYAASVQERTRKIIHDKHEKPCMVKMLIFIIWCVAIITRGEG